MKEKIFQCSKLACESTARHIHSRGNCWPWEKQEQVLINYCLSNTILPHQIVSQGSRRRWSENVRKKKHMRDILTKIVQYKGYLKNTYKQWEKSHIIKGENNFILLSNYNLLNMINLLIFIIIILKNINNSNSWLNSIHDY